MTCVPIFILGKQKYLNENRITILFVYFDNFFSSPELLMDLIDLGIYGCRTLRTNRKHFPQQLRNDAKQGLANRGDYEIAQSGCLTVNICQDNQPVLVIASNCIPKDVTTIKRRVRETRTDFSCPTAIASYKKYMGGVDFFQSRKWSQRRLSNLFVIYTVG